MTAQQIKRAAVAATIVAIAVLIPFAVFGDAYAVPLFARIESQWVAALAAIALLTCDSVAPVPSSVVILFVASKAGPVVGALASLVGLTGGVWAASLLGQRVGAHLLPRFLSTAERQSYHVWLDRNLIVALAIWRSVPVLAETSVILAAIGGISTWRIIRVTLLPNAAIAVVYSLAVQHSAYLGAAAFLITVTISIASWLWMRRISTHRQAPPATAGDLPGRRAQRPE